MINEKDNLRNLIWKTLEDNKISKSPKGPFGRIPDFIGSTLAAKKLRDTEEWRNSKVIFSSPDSAQKKVREFALKDKKILIMVSPKLKSGYLLINPSDVIENEKDASTIKGAFKFGKCILNFPKVDLVVEGSVAVDISGNRLGKGGGYGDVEINHLIEEKAINPETPIATTVHEIQVINHVPTEIHDQKINMIITQKRVIRI